MKRTAYSVPWRPLGNTGVHYWLVHRMAKRCGVNTAKAVTDGAIDQQDWVGMVQTCRGCQWTNGCKRWLEHLDDDGSVTPPAECLNAKLLETLAEGQQDP